MLLLIDTVDVWCLIQLNVPAVKRAWSELEDFNMNSFPPDYCPDAGDDVDMKPFAMHVSFMLRSACL